MRILAPTPCPKRLCSFSNRKSAGAVCFISTPDSLGECLDHTCVLINAWHSRRGMFSVEELYEGPAERLRASDQQLTETPLPALTFNAQVGWGVWLSSLALGHTRMASKGTGQKERSVCCWTHTFMHTHTHTYTQTHCIYIQCDPKVY